MKKAIVFSSVTGNTKKMAAAIQNAVGDVAYCGGVSDEALDADILYVGSWTTAFSCTPDIKEFLTKLNNKKVFLFMSAGYGNTDEFFKPIMDSVKENVNSTNEIIGEFICQGEVSANKQEAIKKMDMAKYEGMKAKLDESIGCPTQAHIEQLEAVVK